MSTTTDIAQANRDEAIADFFKVVTGLLRLCKPLIETAVKEKNSARNPRK